MNKLLERMCFKVGHVFSSGKEEFNFFYTWNLDCQDNVVLLNIPFYFYSDVEKNIFDVPFKMSFLFKFLPNREVCFERCVENTEKFKKLKKETIDRILNEFYFIFERDNISLALFSLFFENKYLNTSDLKIKKDSGEIFVTYKEIFERISLEYLFDFSKERKENNPILSFTKILVSSFKNLKGKRLGDPITISLSKPINLNDTIKNNTNIRLKLLSKGPLS